MNEERMQKAIQEASDAFWAKIAEEYKEIKTGDVAPLNAFEFDIACEKIVKHWIESNS